jgi:hypothetical protein
MPIFFGAVFSIDFYLLLGFLSELPHYYLVLLLIESNNSFDSLTNALIVGRCLLLENFTNLGG